MEEYQERSLRFYPIYIEADYGKLGKKQYKGILLESGDSQMVLHWENTKIKNYDNPFYDHIEYIDEDGVEHRIYGVNEMNILMDILYDSGFPYENRPMPENDVYETIFEMGKLSLEKFLEEEIK